MSITQNQLIEIAMLLEQATDLQVKNLVSTLRLRRVSIQDLLKIPPAEMQQVLDSLGAKANELPFMEVFNAYLRHKLAKGASSYEKKKYGLEADNTQEQQALMLKMQQQKAKIELAKMQEELLKLRIGNKKDSEEYINVEILMPILSQGLGNIANQLRAMAMFHPELIDDVNGCIEEIIKTGHSLVSESKNETEKYLNEFRITEVTWIAMVDELEELNKELQRVIDQPVATPVLSSFGES